MGSYAIMQWLRMHQQHHSECILLLLMTLPTLKYAGALLRKYLAAGGGSFCHCHVQQTAQVSRIRQAALGVQAGSLAGSNVKAWRSSPQHVHRFP